MECCCCGECFESKESGYKRIGISTKFKGGASASETLEKHFSVTITPGKAAFICSSCSLTIRSLDVNRKRLTEVEDKFRKIRRPGSYLATKLPATPQHRGSSKRQKVISTKIQTTPKSRVHHAKPDSKIILTVNNSAIGRAVQLISQAKYKSGIRQLLKSSKAAKKFTTHIFCEVIRKEVCNFASEIGKRKEGGLQSILNFKWENIIGDAEKLCPIMLEMLIASVTKKQHHKFCTKKKNKKIVSLIPIIGCLLMTIGYTRTTKCSMLQQMISIMMWLGGCKRKVFASLNRIGICQSSDSTRRRLDDIKQDYDTKVNEWRDKLTRKEGEVAEANDTMSDVSLFDLEDIWEDGEEEEEVVDTDEVTDAEVSKSDTGTTTDVSTSTFSNDEDRPSQRSTNTSNSEDTEATSMQTEIVQIFDVNRQYYFDITFDNVNQKIGVRHHVRGKKIPC